MNVHTHLRVDAHVHCYPEHDSSAFWGAAHRNFLAARPPRTGSDPTLHEIYALCMASRVGMDMFGEWSTGTRRLPDGFTLHPGDDPLLLTITGPNHFSCLMLACAQLETTERLEVMALGTRDAPPKGLAFREALAWARAHSLATAGPWGLGKWLFARRAHIDSALAAGAFEALIDSAMRPIGWGTPIPINTAHHMGVPVLAGSDPLPPAGQENRVAAYHTLIELDTPPPETASSLVRAMLAPQHPRRPAGRRLSPLAILRQR